MPVQKSTLQAVALDHPINTKVTSEIVDLSPELAEKWLARNTRNRNIRGRKVREFAADMRNGNWRLEVSAIGFDWNGVMLNGQHRCLAVIESGVTIRVNVMKGLDPETREVIDTGGKRSAGDALKFHGVERHVTLIAAVARIALAREGGYLQKALAGSYPTASHSDIRTWVDDNADVAYAVELASATYKAIGVAPAPLAYCIYTLEKLDGSAAVEFITSSAEFRTTGKGDPRTVMMDVFRAAALGQRRKVSVAETIYVIFTAWNAFVSGKSLGAVKPRGTNGDVNGAIIPKPVKPHRTAS